VVASASAPSAPLPSGGLTAGPGVSLLTVSSGWTFGYGLAEGPATTGGGADGSLVGGIGPQRAVQISNAVRSRPAPGTYDAAGRFEPVDVGDGDASASQGLRGLARSDAAERGAGSGESRGARESADAEGGRDDGRDAGGVVPGERLAPEAEAVIRQLRRRDGEVKSHYSAQAAAGGPHSSAASYRYTVGPDGQRYATDGSISFHMDTQGTPQHTAAQARAVRMAALAPANAGPRDLAVAAAAMRVELGAREAVRDALADEHARDVGRFVDHHSPHPVVSEIQGGQAITNAAEDVGSSYADELAADTFVNRPDYLDAEGAVRG